MLLSLFELKPGVGGIFDIGCTISAVAFQFIILNCILIIWYYKPVVKNFKSRKLFLNYMQLIVSATWFIGVRLICFCYNVIKTTKFEVRRILLSKYRTYKLKFNSYFFKAKVFCFKQKELKKIVLKHEIGIMRKLYPHELTLEEFHKRWFNSKGKVESLAIFKGKKVIFEITRKALYALFLN